MTNVRSQFANEKIEERRIETNNFYDYEDLRLQNLKEEDKEEFKRVFKHSKIVYLFIPFWYMSITKENNVFSNKLR